MGGWGELSLFPNLRFFRWKIKMDGLERQISPCFDSPPPISMQPVINWCWNYVMQNKPRDGADCKKPPPVSLVNLPRHLLFTSASVLSPWWSLLASLLVGHDGDLSYLQLIYPGESSCFGGRTCWHSVLLRSLYSLKLVLSRLFFFLNKLYV